MKTTRTARFLAATIALLCASPIPLLAQGVICCSQTVNLGGNWVGYSRTCDLSGVPPDKRAEICKNLSGCAQVAAYCGGGDRSGTCDPKLYEDYLRKRQAAMELFKHASDLRLRAAYLIGERMGIEWANLRFDAELSIAGDLGWEEFGQHVIKGMGGSRGTLNASYLVRKTVENAPFGVKAWNVLGWLDLLLETSARAWLTAGEWSDYQKEAKKATEAAQEMWRKALADFEAYLKQAPQCLAESREAANEEKKIERAKQVIEEWENNQILYWDPIRNEAVNAEAALKRAKAYLASGLISGVTWRIMKVASHPGSGREPDQQALEAAIRELDAAIASFDRLNKALSGYLRAQYAIEKKIAQAFAEGARVARPRDEAGANPAQKGGASVPGSILKGIDPGSILRGIFGR